MKNTIEVIDNGPFFTCGDQLYLYLHLPKSGGTAFRRTFLPGHSSRKHPTMDMYKSKWPDLYANAVKFATLRDDFARFQSFCNWVFEGGEKWHTDYLKKHHLHDPLSIFRHFRDRNQFLEPHKVLERRRLGLKRVLMPVIGHNRPFLNEDIDFALRFENLQDDINELCRRLHIEPVDMPVVRPSARSNKITDPEIIEYFEALPPVEVPTIHEYYAKQHVHN